MTEHGSSRAKEALLVLAGIVGVVACTIWWAATPESGGRSTSNGQRGEVSREELFEGHGRTSATKKLPRKDEGIAGSSSGVSIKGSSQGRLDSVQLDRSGTQQGLSIAVNVNNQRVVLSGGTTTVLGIHEAAPQIVVRWEATLRPAAYKDMAERTPELWLTPTDGIGARVPARMYGGPMEEGYPSARGEIVRGRMEWEYEIVGLDALLERSGEPKEFQIVAQLDALTCTRNVTICAGLLPTSFSVEDEPGRDGLVAAVAVVHAVAVRGISSVTLEVFDGPKKLPSLFHSVWIEGRRIDIPATMTRHLTDSYLEVRARVLPEWKRLPGGWARLTVVSSTGALHVLEWRCRDID